jgi:hypothetical protein
MHSRIPLLLFVAALPFAGCTCQWQTNTNRAWSTNSGGEQVVVVQEDPGQVEREREARMAREREWERERERERSRHPVVIGAGGRTGTHAAPHSPSGGYPSAQPDAPTQHGRTGRGSYAGEGYSGGGSPGGIGAPAEQPAAPVAPPPVAPAPAPEPTPNDSYVAPREIHRPAGGPSRGGSATPEGEDKRRPATPRTGRMTRQQ